MFEKYKNIKNNTRSFHISIRAPKYDGLKVGVYVLYLAGGRVFLDQNEEKDIRISARLDVFSDTLNDKYINCRSSGNDLIFGYANNNDKLAIQAEELSMGVISAPSSDSYRKLIEEYLRAKGWKMKQGATNDLWFEKDDLEAYIEYLHG